MCFIQDIHQCLKVIFWFVAIFEFLKLIIAENDFKDSSILGKNFLKMICDSWRFLRHSLLIGEVYNVLLGHRDQFEEYLWFDPRKSNFSSNSLP